MKTIELIYSRWQTKRVCRRLNSVGGKRFFIVFETTPKDIVDELTHAGWTKAPTMQWNQSERERFLKEYVKLIDQCGVKAPDQKIWWATYIASKNRFASGMPELLQQFLTILRLAKSPSCDHLILINPSWTILSAVRSAIGAPAVQFNYPSVYFHKWKEILHRRLYYSASLMYQAMRLGIRCIKARRIYQGIFPLPRITTEPWYVMKSFIYDHSFKNGVYQDIFFGPLLPFLQKSRSIVIFGTILGQYSRCLKRMHQTPSVTMIPLELMFRLREIVSAAWTLLRLQIRIQSPLLFFGHDIGSIVNNELNRTANGIDLYHYLHYEATGRFLKHVGSIATFLYTYENNPWERMCVSAIRAWSPQTRIIGYQQNVVPQASANLFIGHYERQQHIGPDRIFTTGNIPKRILEKYGAYEPGDLQVGCGLRFSPVTPLPSTVSSRPPYRVLVAMEGIIAVYKMVNMVLRQLGGDDQYRIRIRAHPVLSVDALRRYFIGDLANFSNVEISRGNTLMEDIKWADIVIYWGSTVALETLTLGKRLVYYDNSSILSYDSLFECPALKRTIFDEGDLREKLKELLTLPEGVVEQERRNALEYTQEYISPITEEKLSVFNL